MASANNQTGFHIAFIVTFVLMGLFITMWYISSDEAAELRAQVTTLKTENSNYDSVAKERADIIDQMKGVIGTKATEAGDVTDPEPGTTFGDMNFAMSENGTDPPQQTMIETIVMVSQERDNVTQQLNSLQSDVVDYQQEIKSLKMESQVRIDAFENRAKKAEQDLNERITVTATIIKSGQDTIAQLRADKRGLQDDLNRTKGEFDEVQTELEGQVDVLTVRNIDLQNQIQEVRKVSFEIPDGKISRVDHARGLVWINRGSADKLRPRTTFSVYTKAHSGVARGGEDIKASIEVTQVLNSHLAEARILATDIRRPVSPDDPIYTPIWSPGRAQHIAMIGLVAFDGHKDDDRDRFHEILKTVNAVVDWEVGPDGLPTAEFADLNMEAEIDINTRFLVVGQIPDQTDAATDEEVAYANAIQVELIKLERIARQQGVTIVSLPNFLNYIGFSSTHRTFVPGQERPYTLKNGSPASGVNAAGVGRYSSGTVSGLYTRGRHLVRPGETGNLKKVRKK